MIPTSEDIKVWLKAVPIGVIINLANLVKLFFAWLGWSTLTDQLMKNDSTMVNLAGFLGLTSVVFVIASAVVAIVALVTGNYTPNNLG
jgi:hypothetical protein